MLKSTTNPPFNRYFMDERRGSRGSPGRKRTGQSPGGVEPGKRRSPNNARSRSPEKRSSKPKERPGPAKPKETALERKEREEKEAKEKKEKEDQEYQERLSKLSTPEREVRVDVRLCRNRTNSFPGHGGSEEEVRGKVKCERGQDQDLPQDVSIHPKPGSGGSFVSYLNGYCVCSSQRSTNVS